ncbi:MAG TPA: protein kinase [Pantanalinema sp.]
MADLRTHRELTERGEAAIVSALLALGDAYVVLPHLLLSGMLGPRNPDDLDVVVLGPAGAALIEYRHWHGRLTVSEAPTPWILHYAAGGSEPRPNPVSSLRDKAQALLEHLSASGAAPATVLKAVVVPDRTRIEGEAQEPVMPLSALALWLEGALSGPASPWTLQAADLLRPPVPPRMVNQYRLTSLLGREGDHTTYLAFDTLKHRLVTLREMPYDPFQRPEDLDRARTELLREAKLTMELFHPAIARIDQLIPQDDCYYVVGEWIEGAQNLREALSHGVLTVESALDLAIACADALAYAHGRGIVHRNVRPENILLAGRAVKLTNFKMAKKADLGTRSTFDLRQMAQENPYAAPEFKLGAEGHHRVDVRADVYALGAVLYEALSGNPPVHLDEKYWHAPSASRSGIPEGLDAAIQQALRFDPAQRFSTMAAFRERLLAIREGRSADPKPARYVERRLVKRTRNSLLYRALDRERGHEVALKKILLDPAVCPDARSAAVQRLLREAQIARTLVHPRIVTVLDQFVEDEDPYVVMEWLEGHDVREHLDGRRAALTCEEALDLVRQAGEALSYAHEQGIVHCDLKPENLMREGSRVTVLDFGLASRVGADPSPEALPAGTPRYMAPEVLQGLAADPRSDVFSLAVVLYELLTGRYPYGPEVLMGRFAPSESETMLAPPSHLNLAVPPALDAPLMRALAVAPEARTPTMAEFLAELAAADEAMNAGGFLPRGNAPLRALFLGGLGLVVVGGLGLGVYLGGPGLIGGLPQQSAPQPSPADAFASRPALERTPAPLPSEVPAPEPTPQPTQAPVTPAHEVSWASSAVSINGVTVRVERIIGDKGQSLVTLKVTNGTDAVVSFLKPQEALGRLVITDDLSGDYSRDVDWTSLPLVLSQVEAGQTAEGTLRLTRTIDPAAGMVRLLLKEDGGVSREFLLRAYRLEN